MEDGSKILDNYHAGEKGKTIVVTDDAIAYMSSNIKFEPIYLFITCNFIWRIPNK